MLKRPSNELARRYIAKVNTIGGLRSVVTGNRDMVKLLLDRGANIEAPTESGTPLHWAAGSGSQEVVETLLVAGADPNVKTPDGVTAILMASAAGKGC